MTCHPYEQAACIRVFLVGVILFLSPWTRTSATRCAAAETTGYSEAGTDAWADPNAAPDGQIWAIYGQIHHLWQSRRDELGLATPYLQSPEQLQAAFDQAWQAQREWWLNQAETGYAFWYYFHQYLATGLLAMYRATGEEHYLADVRYIADRMLATATDDPAKTAQGGDGYLGWPIRPDIPSESILNSLQPARLLSSLARTMADAGFHPSTWYKYYGFVVTQVVARWNLLHPDPDCDEPFFVPAHAIALLTDLAAINHADEYRDAIVQWEAILERYLQVSDTTDGYWWRLRPRSDSAIADTSHGYRMPEALHWAFSAGYAFDAEHMRRLVRTFLINTWRPQEENPFLWTNLVNGSNPPIQMDSYYYEPYQAGFVGVGWPQLARYDVYARKLYELVADALIHDDPRLSEAASMNDSIYSRMQIFSILLECPPPPPSSPARIAEVVLENARDVVDSDADGRPEQIAFDLTIDVDLEDADADDFITATITELSTGLTRQIGPWAVHGIGADDACTVTFRWPQDWAPIPKGDYTLRFQVAIQQEWAEADVSSQVSNGPLFVRKINNPPVANDCFLKIPQGEAAALTLTCTDTDEDAVTWFLVNPPQNGTLTGTLPELVYTPQEGFWGVDQFTFCVYDGSAYSNLALAEIVVLGSPDIDGNGMVDIGDVIILVNAFGTHTGEPGFVPEADLDCNGCVDVFDVLVVITDFGREL